LNKFVITSDSSCDLGSIKAKELDIDCAFLTYTIEDDVFYDDMVEEHINEFYEKMRKGAIPKTSQIPPSEFVKFFENQVKKGLPVLHLSVSSHLSGTYLSATIAAKEVMSKNPDAYITVVDTEIGSAGIAMMLFEAVKYRDEEKTIEQAVSHLNAIKYNINVFITTNDLTYMRRGGRVSTAGAIISSVLNICPIISLPKSGKLYVKNKVRGNSATLDKFIECVSDTVLKPEKQTLYIAHSDAIDKAKEYGEKLVKEFGFKNIEYLKFGTTIGSHAGPGLVSAWYFGKVRPIIKL